MMLEIFGIQFRKIYDGITLNYIFSQKGLKYEFLLESYADLESIKMVYKNVDNVVIENKSIEIEKNGMKFTDDVLACPENEQCRLSIHRLQVALGAVDSFDDVLLRAAHRRYPVSGQFSTFLRTSRVGCRYNVPFSHGEVMDVV